MDTAPRSETEILLLAVAAEERFLARLAEGVDREDVSALLDNLRADEEGHRTRLLSLLWGVEADGAVAAARPPAWLGSSGCHTIPAGQPH